MRVDVSARIAMVLLAGSAIFVVSPTLSDAQVTRKSAVGTLSYKYNAKFKDGAISLSVEPANLRGPDADLDTTDVLVVERTSRPPERVHIPTDFGMVTAILRINDNKFLLVQTSSAPYAGIEIFDATRMRFTSSFPCYSPTVSPDRRFLAYIKMFPAHFDSTSTATSNFVIVDDLVKNGSQNRYLQASELGAVSDEDGLLVFPISYNLSYKTRSAITAKTFNVLGRLYFSQNSNRLFFLVSQYPAQRPASKQDFNVTNDASLPAGTQLSYVLVNLARTSPSTSVLPIPDCEEPAGDDCGISLISADIGDATIPATIRRAMLPDITQSLPVSDFRALH